MAVRNSINDFIRDVAARTVGSVVYVATLNSDNVSVKITRNGVTIWNKVMWPGPGASALTDTSSPNYDTVAALGGEGTWSTVATQQFLNSLV